MPDRANAIFRAIADPTRREIFHVLVVAATTMSITQISDHFDMSRQGVTKHLKILETADLVHINPEGRERFCLANPHSLSEIRDWVAYYEGFWDDNLERLKNHLDNSDKV